MNLRHLEHLLAVAETGSFSRAAEQQHLTQSALSRSIQALEGELGARLIDRVGKRNELTPLGQAVAQRARRIVLDAEELRHVAALHRQGESGTLRVGLSSGPAALLLTPLLLHMARHHPKVQVTASPGSPELQLMQLRQRSLDALVGDSRRMTPAPDLCIELLAPMQAGFVCRAGHPLTRLSGPIHFETIARYPLASTPLSGEIARTLVQRFGPGADPQQSVQLRCEDINSLLEVVQRSDAVFLGIVAAARAGIASGTLALLEVAVPLTPGAQYAFVTLHGRAETPSLRLLRQFVGEHLRD